MIIDQFKLTNKEVKICELILTGQSYKKIANQMGIVVNTVGRPLNN